MRRRITWTLALVGMFLLAVGIALAGGVAAGATNQSSANAVASPSPSSPPIVLQVEHNGTLVKQYTLAQLEALTPVPGYAGFMNSANNVTGPEAVTGAKITDIVQDALGAPLAASQSVDVIDVSPPDGTYGMTYSYDQLVNLAGFTMYNAKTKDPVSLSSLKGPLAAVLIYSDPDQNVMPPSEGPLRFAIADARNEDAVMVGSDSVYSVNTINVRDFVAKDWSIQLAGLEKNGKRLTRTITRNDFQGCAAPGCHGSSYRSGGSTWTGTPLYLLVGEVDGGADMTYNAALARKNGYRVELTTTGGHTVILSSSSLVLQTHVILANEANGAVLGSSLFPLRLVGPKLATPTEVGQVKSIVLLPPLKKKR